MTTEMTRREEMALAKPDPLDAFQQATKDDLVLPIRKLVQGTSRKADTSKAGQFWDETLDTYKTKMNVAIITVKRERSYFADDNLDSPPICASNDAVAPRERVDVGGETTGPTCEVCPFSQWGSDGKGQACQFSYVLLLYDLDDSEMFILRVGGASRGDWKKYLTRGQRQGIAAYSVTTIIGSEKRRYPKGSAFAITFTAGVPLTDDTTEFMREKVMEYQKVALMEEVPVRDVDEDAPPPEDMPFE